MNWSTITMLISELSALSPMPNDDVLLADEEGLADKYDELIERINRELAQVTLTQDQEAALVTVLADSFGPGDGMGIYWSTLHVIERCTPPIAFPIVRDRALHGSPGSRVWCCFILGRKRDSQDEHVFLTLLNDNVPEVQVQALHALVMLSQQVSLQHVLPNIRALLEHSDPRVRKAAQRALDAIGT